MSIRLKFGHFHILIALTLLTPDHPILAMEAPLAPQKPSRGCLALLISVNNSWKEWAPFSKDEIENWTKDALETFDFYLRSHKNSERKFNNPQVVKAIREARAANIYASSIFQAAGLRELYEIAYTAGVAETIADYSAKRNKEIRKVGTERTQALKISAKILLQRIALPDLASGRVLTDSEFVNQALLAQVKIENFQRAYRFDSRNPEEIRTQKGLLPNPSGKACTLTEHSLATNNGGGTFVSLTESQGNPFIVTGEFFKRNQSDFYPTPEQIDEIANSPNIYYPVVESQPARFPMRANHISPVKPPSIQMTYEYEAGNVRGAKPLNPGDAESEKEIVTNFVNADQIVRYRKVYLFRWDLAERIHSSGSYRGSDFVYSVSYEEWKSF